MKQIILGIVVITTATQVQAQSLCRKHIEEVAAQSAKHALAKEPNDIQFRKAALENAITAAELVCGMSESELNTPVIQEYLPEIKVIDSKDDCKNKSGG